ncbi:MAG: hypothetical protein H6Q71_290 [Firmicutes bacterium]|nr:hypothetical protein [Bacillota bacterium]
MNNRGLSKERSIVVRLNLRQHSTQLLISGCLIVAVVGYFFWPPGLAAFSGSVPDNSQHSIISQEVAQPVMDYPAPPVMRDPFAVPKEFQPVMSVPASSPPARNTSVLSTVSSQTAMPEITVELVGIVTGGGQRVAIIKKAGDSRSYQIKEYIGPYQLLAIGESSVTLWGTQGEKVLTVER